MASNAGEWYEEKRLEAERLAHELTGARTVLRAVQEAERAGGSPLDIREAAAAVVRRLHREHERACYVGD